MLENVLTDQRMGPPQPKQAFRTDEGPFGNRQSVQKDIKVEENLEENNPGIVLSTGLRMQALN